MLGSSGLVAVLASAPRLTHAYEPRASPVKGIIVVYFVMSVVTFCVYGLDKRAARRRSWRMPEATLHLLDLAGGWPGGLVAQRVFRHKTRKRSFLVMFWFTVAANLVFLGVLWTTL